MWKIFVCGRSGKTKTVDGSSDNKTNQVNKLLTKVPVGDQLLPVGYAIATIAHSLKNLPFERLMGILEQS
jgi:hypothetical protein